MFTWPRLLILGLFQAVRPAEILSFFASLSCQSGDDSQANSEDLSQKFLTSAIRQLLAITLVALKGTLALKKKKEKDIFQSNY